MKTTFLLSLALGLSLFGSAAASAQSEVPATASQPAGIIFLKPGQTTQTAAVIDLGVSSGITAPAESTESIILKPGQQSNAGTSD
jgi:hypothetical protein